MPVGHSVGLHASTTTSHNNVCLLVRRSFTLTGSGDLQMPSLNVKLTARRVAFGSAGTQVRPIPDAAGPSETANWALPAPARAFDRSTVVRGKVGPLKALQPLSTVNAALDAPIMACPAIPSDRIERAGRRCWAWPAGRR